MQPGYDPSLCCSGTKPFVGFHTDTNDAHLASSDAAWQTVTEVDWDSATAGTQRDDSGKFVSVACAGDTVAASWGDWPNKDDAIQHLDSTRQLGMIVARDGGTTWQTLQPAGTDGGQLVATVAVRDGRVAVLWRTSSALRLAIYTWP